MLDVNLLSLLRLVSPALPVGAFAYSQGLEGAVEQQFVNNEAQAKDWISGVLQHSIAELDLPALYWQIAALEEQDIEGFRDFNQTIFAHRETAELRLESHQLAQALCRLLRDTDATNSTVNKTDIHALLQTNAFQQIDWVTAFALASYCYDIDRSKSLLGFAWAWAETQVAAAVKLVPLGQTQGQRLLIQLSEDIAQLIAELSDRLSQQTLAYKAEIGAISPNLAIVSSQHETQYSRLFRS